MKKITHILLLVIAGSLLSCNEDVLDKEPLNIISDAVVWRDKALINAYLTQCYSEFKFINDIEFGGWTYWFALATQTNIADECTVGWEGYDPDYSGGKSFMYRTDYTFGEWWGYTLVRKLNIFLEHMPEAQVDEAFKNERIAEARFLRAFGYFNMVKRYGGVPLITIAQEIDSPEEELFPTRAKEEAVYDFIITEVDAILDDLQDVQNADGRPSKYAALALKSRAAMYAASIATWGEVKLDGIVGIPSGKSEQYWQSSYAASQAIINSGKFELYSAIPDDKVSNYRNIFLDENNEEVIFSEVYDGQTSKGHHWDFFNDPFGYHAWGTGGESVAYLEMVEEYENIDGSSGKINRQKIEDGHLWTIDELFGNKDPRFRASILTQGGVWLGDTINVYRGIIHEDGTIAEDNYKGVPGKGKSTSDRPYATPFMMLKYMDESLGIAPFAWEAGTSKTDWIVFRYAETLLNYAEAAYELGKSGEALDAINQIRTRAGIALLTSIDREKIRHERKVELAFEGNRYWDVRRWRTAETDLSIPLSSSKFILDYKTRKFKLEVIDNIDGSMAGEFLPRNYYLPITLERVKNNPKLVENPGY